MHVLIRPAKPSDITRMCGLLCELFSLESDFSADREKQARGLELLISNTKGTSIVLVAERGDEIIGMCSVQTLISTAEGGPVGLLEDLIVKKADRGNRTGAMLLSEIIAWCAARDISRIQLLRDIDNAKAMDFYNANGWQGTRLICMRKFL